VAGVLAEEPTAVLGSDPATADRSRAVLTLGLLLTAWGGVLGLFALGVRVGLGGAGDGLGPLPTSRAAIFASSGVILVLIGLSVGLARSRGGTGPGQARVVEAGRRRPRADGPGRGDRLPHPKRDPWVVAFVASAAPRGLGGEAGGRGRAAIRGEGLEPRG
jgi:hypothetical protein